MQKRESYAKMKHESGVTALIYAEPGLYHDKYWAEMSDGSSTDEYISYVRILQYMMGLGFKKVPLLDEAWEHKMMMVEAFGGYL